MADSKDGARGFAKPALVASDQAPSGLDPSGFDPARGCECRLCRYDVEFAAHLASVPEEHRAFFEDLKERWEAADFDATWERAQREDAGYFYDAEGFAITIGGERHGPVSPLRQALGFAEQALSVAANSPHPSAEHALYSRALRTARKALTYRDRDAALRRREAAEAEGQQPGPERSEGIAQPSADTAKQERG